MRIDVTNLSKNYGDFCAVNNISFSFESGRIFSLIGRNGSGKTSTIRMMLGTLSKDSGKVLVNGKPLNRQLNNIGYLSEERGLYIKDPIIDQLVFLGCLKGMNRKQAKKTALDWLDKLGILDRANDKLESLSKGNQQKIQIVASLLHDPDICIFDEPFSGLDPVNAQFLIDLVKSLKKKNKCILLSSHQLHLLEHVVDDLAIISYSNIMYSGTLKELKEEKGGNQVIVQFPKNQNDKVKRIQYLQKNSEGKYAVEINGTRTYQSVLQDLIANNLTIESLEIKEKTLNDIFIEMEGSK